LAVGSNCGTANAEAVVLWNYKVNFVVVYCYVCCSFPTNRYAQPLLDGLSGLPGWPVQVKKLQELWIGKSEGMMVHFGPVRIFTTCIETLMGVTFVAVAPSSPLREKKKEKMNSSFSNVFFLFS
jgi:leucyl-tRNA synthetase